MSSLDLGRPLGPRKGCESAPRTVLGRRSGLISAAAPTSRLPFGGATEPVEPYSCPSRCSWPTPCPARPSFEAAGAWAQALRTGCAAPGCRSPGSWQGLAPCGGLSKRRPGSGTSSGAFRSLRRRGGPSAFTTWRPTQGEPKGSRLQLQTAGTFTEAAALAAFLPGLKKPSR